MKNAASSERRVFARGLAWKIISRGFLIGAVTLVAFIVRIINIQMN